MRERIRTFFGTDGVRGKANQDPMTAETALKIGMAAGCQFIRGDHRHTVVIGKDTRLSGYLLEPALTAGFIAVGMDVILLGPLPTPGVAMLTHSLRADLGVMISASHNPYEDNGIKLFGPDGFKLSDDTEAGIEARMGHGLETMRVGVSKLGRARRLDDAPGRYIEFVKATFPRGLRLDGLRVVVDCAHGAAYRIAPRVLWELGAEVIETGVEPDGFNINQNCGSQHTGNICTRVIADHAHLGIALDGDADRVVLCDEKGGLIDGDQLLALTAREWQCSQRLQGGAVVATIMSNLGLERHLRATGLKLIRTQVGDRYVVEEMLRRGCNLGGEPSGHIILSDYTTTGDGLVAALQMLAKIARSGKPASHIARQFEPMPQILRNIRLIGSTDAILAADMVMAAVREGEERLDGRGRLLIRKSGTEPLIRVMAEGEDATLLAKIVKDVIAAIKNTTERVTGRMESRIDSSVTVT
ncbi:Phosphoglucosamine mutase [invertebrate metagenome]|uniref:Phosphoglucosamine mutase n=1 Tax=invertebrate metagenome TaxID=1711999 RepID=A0A484H6X6_9ZZZZ